jgi:hypothetical protein
MRYVDPSGHVCTEGQGTNDEYAKPGNCDGGTVPYVPTAIFGGMYPRSPEAQGPEVTSQMPAWVTDANGTTIPDEFLIRYPGSKRQQSEDAKVLALESSVRLICYSAGTEACLIYAKWRIDHGLGVEDVVLLGPTFSGRIEERGPEIGFGESGGGFDDWASYIDYFLANGTDVLVIDDGNPFDRIEESGYVAPQGASGTFFYRLVLLQHYDSGGFLRTGTNNNEHLKEYVYWWMTEATP